MNFLQSFLERGFSAPETPPPIVFQAKEVSNPQKGVEIQQEGLGAFYSDKELEVLGFGDAEEGSNIVLREWAKLIRLGKEPQGGMKRLFQGILQTV
jgi:hypothetical protein